jgi:hypothetical protein
VPLTLLCMRSWCLKYYLMVVHILAVVMFFFYYYLFLLWFFLSDFHMNIVVLWIKGNQIYLYPLKINMYYVSCPYVCVVSCMLKNIQEWFWDRSVCCSLLFIGQQCSCGNLIKKTKAKINNNKIMDTNIFGWYIIIKYCVRQW